MALHANTVWEIRTTGSQTAGGGFYNRNPGTSVDYSQQNSPVLTLTSIYTDGTTVIEDTGAGGFTPAMVGNIIYLATSAGVPIGWYEITSWFTSWRVSVDRAVAGGSGRKGYVGGAFKIGGALDTDFFAVNNKVAGNKVWIKAGTYTLGESVSLAATSSATNPIQVVGYQNSRGDNPIGNNRPILNCGSSYLVDGAQYWVLLNLIFTGSAANVLRLTAAGAVCYNCKSTNTSTTSGRKALDVTTQDNTIISCEFQSTNGIAVSVGSGVNNLLVNCYIHDSSTGILFAGIADQIINCVIADCSTVGINMGSYKGVVFGSIIYNCLTGISASSSSSSVFINNIISGCTTGASWDTEQKINFWNFNCWYNTTDVVNVTKGPNDISADPKLKDPANGDFTLDTGSPCFDAGMQLGAIVGL